MASKTSRRDFLRTAAGGAAAVGLPYFMGSRAWGANERLGLGFIGVCGMGSGHL